MYYRWFGSGFIIFFIINSMWLIVVMVGERYIVVCYFFKVRKFILLKKIKIVICLVYGICMILIIFLFFE